MVLSSSQRIVLAHVVEDPDAWYDNAVEVFGQQVADKHLETKVARHKPSYEREKVKPGYKPRAVRQAAETARNQAEIVASIEARDAALQARIDAAVAAAG